MSGTRSLSALDAEDASLAQAVGAGDRGALANVFRAYATSMKHVALSVTGSAMEADDVVQDVFLRLPDSICGFEGRCPLWGWLRRVTVLRARMAVRARARLRESRLPLDPSTPASQDDAIDLIALERAFGALPPRHRAVLLLKQLGGLTHDEVARTLGTTANVSCVTLCRAKQKLRVALDVESPRHP